MVEQFFNRVFRLKENAPELPIVSAVDSGVAVKRIELGKSGTRIYSGYPEEEYLQNLRGKARADIFDQMRRGDTQITMCLAAVNNPIKSGTWEIEPGAEAGAEPTPEAIEDANLVRHILFEDLDRPWEKFVSEALTVNVFGHAVFEVTHKVVLNHPKYGSFNGLKSLAWRSPRTIDKWIVSKETGRLAAIVQDVEGDLADTGAQQIEISDQYLLTISLNQEGSNYEGISLLRPCYGPWKRKDLYLKINAIGIEKFAVPTPLAEIPPDKINSEQQAYLEDALQKYISHESNYLIYPSGWKITLNNSPYDPAKVEASIDGEDKRIAKAFLANFLELGMNGTGSFALSNDLSDFMLSGLEHIAREICAPINQDLIPQLVRLNRGERQFYPRLKVTGISDKAGQELADMLMKLSNTNWLTPEDGDEAHLRRRMGLPSRTGKGVREKPAPSTGFFSEREPVKLSERIYRAAQRALDGNTEK